MGEKDHSDQHRSETMRRSGYVPLDDDSARVRQADRRDPIARAELLADICRINTLYMIMHAGSGTSDRASARPT